MCFALPGEKSVEGVFQQGLACCPFLGCNQAARLFDVSPSCGVNIMSRFQEDGTHRPWRAGREVGPGKRAPYRDFLIEILTPTPDITRVEMSEALMENFDVSASLPDLLYYLRKHGDTYKNF